MHQLPRTSEYQIGLLTTFCFVSLRSFVLDRHRYAIKLNGGHLAATVAAVASSRRCELGNELVHLLVLDGHLLVPSSEELVHLCLSLLQRGNCLPQLVIVHFQLLHALYCC